jgi:hypothetical protein
MVDAFGKISASTARQRREPALRLVHSEQDLVKFSSLSHYEIAPDSGGRFSAGRSFLERLNLPQAETRLLGVSDELKLFQRGKVITSAATYPLCWRQDADLFVVAQSRWAHPYLASDRSNR